jgi:hypothetical protein
VTNNTFKSIINSVQMYKINSRLRIFTTCSKRINIKDNYRCMLRSISYPNIYIVGISNYEYRIVDLWEAKFDMFLNNQVHLIMPPRSREISSSLCDIETAETLLVLSVLGHKTGVQSCVMSRRQQVGGGGGRQIR